MLIKKMRLFMLGFCVVLLMLLYVLTNSASAAEMPVAVPPAPAWTLAASVRRAVEAAPQMRAATAEIAVRESAVTQAGAMPNPSIDLRADNKLGLEDGRGGADFTQFAVSQPIPWRLLYQRNPQHAAASASLKGAQQESRARRLVLEQDAARLFHAAQFARARVALAQSRLDRAKSYLQPAAGKRRDPLVRYLAPLERARLGLLREESEQAVRLAEKDEQLVLADFRSRLALPVNAPVAVVPLDLAAPAAALAAATPADLERSLDAHPALLAAREQLAAARAEIEVAQTQRMNDPALNFFRERDFVGGARRDVTGIGVSVQIPLWHKNDSPVAKSRAEALRVQAEQDLKQRDALAQLRSSYIGLAGLVKQAERLRTNLIEPARQLLELTRRGFAAGEANLLALVDAINTYYEAEQRYLELLRDSQFAAAELRYAAGQSLLAELATGQCSTDEGQNAHEAPPHPGPLPGGERVKTDPIRCRESGNVTREVTK